MSELCKWPACNCRATGQYCKSKPVKKKPHAIRKVSKKGILRAQDKALMLNTDMLFYLEIWNEREHVCFECDQLLGNQPLLMYFHHLCPKGIEKFKQFRHQQNNIVLLCWQCHNKVTSSLSSLPKTFSLYLETLKRYGL